jgi:molybdenum cofactor cytidylyltransferase
MYRGERGHPVGFTAACGDALAALGGAKGAAAIVKSHTVVELPVDDEGILVDVDTVEALAQAERLLQLRRHVT